MTDTLSPQNAALPGRPAKFSALDFVMQYGGRCRGCADEDGTCPADGLPCEMDAKRKAVSSVLAALEYGHKHGYIEARTEHPKPAPSAEALDHVRLMLANPNTHFHYSTGRDAVQALFDAVKGKTAPSAEGVERIATAYYDGFVDGIMRQPWEQAADWAALQGQAYAKTGDRPPFIPVSALPAQSVTQAETVGEPVETGQAAFDADMLRAIAGKLSSLDRPVGRYSARQCIELLQDMAEFVTQTAAALHPQTSIRGG